MWKPPISVPCRQRLKRLGIVLQKRSAPGEGGIADENVNAAQRFQHRSNDPLAGGPGEDIALYQERLTAQRSDLGHERLA